MPTSLPISEIAKWPVPDDDKGLLINAFFAWTVALEVILVSLRVITRKWVVGARLWWDDYFIITAMIGTLIGAALDACEVHYGFGRHEKYISEYELLMFGKYTYCEWIQTFLTLMSTKVSICFFLLRIPTSKAYIRPLQASIAILIVSNIIITAIWIFQCWPVQLAWNTAVQGHCFSRQFLLNLILAQAVISITSDFALALFPIVILQNLRMRRKQKLGLCLLMGLGVITGTCCVIRTALNGGALPIDGTYGGITNWFWRQFEVQLGIACACIPALVPLYKWIKQKIADSKSPGETTLTSQKGQAEAGTMVDPSIEHPDPLSQPSRSRQMDSSIPRSERAMLTPELCKKESNQTKEDEEEAHEAEHVEDVERAQPPNGLHTFFDNGTDDQLADVTAPQPSAQPAAHSSAKRAKAVSFSRRDLQAQPSLRPGGLPHVHVTTVDGSEHSGESRAVEPAVMTTGDPHQQLEFTGLRPGFEKNRRSFARILDLKRSSWMSWVSSSSTGKGNGNGSAGPSAV